MKAATPTFLIEVAWPLSSPPMLLATLKRYSSQSLCLPSPSPAPRHSYRAPLVCPLLHLPASRHPHLLHSAALADQIDGIVEVYRAADVVRDDLQRVAHLQIVLAGHSEHPMLLGEPLERDAGISHYVTEPLQVQRFDARLHVGGEGLASPVDDGQILVRPANYRAHHRRGAFF